MPKLNDQDSQNWYMREMRHLGFVLAPCDETLSLTRWKHVRTGKYLPDLQWRFDSAFHGTPARRRALIRSAFISTARKMIKGL